MKCDRFYAILRTIENNVSYMCYTRNKIWGFFLKSETKEDVVIKDVVIKKFSWGQEDSESIKFNSKFSDVWKSDLFAVYGKSICRVCSPSGHTYWSVLLNLHAPVKNSSLLLKRNNRAEYECPENTSKKLGNKVGGPPWKFDSKK